MIEEIRGDNYVVTYDRGKGTIYFHGILRLPGSAGYSKITEFLDRVLSSGAESLTIDLRELKLLNSSGITMLSKFVIHARQHPKLALTVQGSKSVFWQERSLGNLQRLLPTMELYLD